tara:strand:+ start:38191 stop:38742 length:552 start_codon:yes stop_codon:yes gene_type:complete
MKKLLNILGTLLLSVTIISCGNETKDHNVKEENIENTLVEKREIIEILKHKSIIFAKSERFDFNTDFENDMMSINTIVLPADKLVCIAETKLCEELTNFIAGNELVYNSFEQHSKINDDEAEYRLMQHGTIEINNTPYSGILYYNGEGNNETGSWFHGKLIFELPEVKALKGESVILELKGKR